MALANVAPRLCQHAARAPFADISGLRYKVDFAASNLDFSGLELRVLSHTAEGEFNPQAMRTGRFSGNAPSESAKPRAGVYGEHEDPELASIFANFARLQKEVLAKRATPGERRYSGVRIQADREMRNGVQRQSPGTVGATLWNIFDAIGAGCSLAQARVAAAAAAINPTTANIHYYRWRQFNGHTGPTA
jgi:hypothetical protein